MWTVIYLPSVNNLITITKTMIFLVSRDIKVLPLKYRNRQKQLRTVQSVRKNTQIIIYNDFFYFNK